MSAGLDGIVQHNERETVKTRPESGLLLLHPQQLEKCSILIISYVSYKCASHFCREIRNENKQKT